MVLQQLHQPSRIFLYKFRKIDNMDLLSSHLVDNRKLTGVAFFPRNDIGVSSYDYDEVALFSSS